MTFFCIADEETVRGFRLIAVAGQVVTTTAEAVAAVANAATRSDCGVILLTDKVAATIRPQLESLRVAQARPLIVEIPGPEGRLPARKTLRQFVQEAVGIHVGQ